MSRTYSLVIEGDETGFSAHVPERPSIPVKGKQVEVFDGRGYDVAQCANFVRLPWPWARLHPTKNTAVCARKLGSQPTRVDPDRKSRRSIGNPFFRHKSSKSLIDKK